MTKPTDAQMAIMHERHVLLAQLRGDRRFLKECFDYAKADVNTRIDETLAALDRLPEIEVRVRVRLFVEDECCDEVSIICTSTEYIAEGVSRALALNKHWMRHIENADGYVEAFFEDVWQLRSQADLVRAASGAS